MPRRTVRSKDAAPYIKDETDGWIKELRACNVTKVLAMLESVSLDDAAFWCCEAIADTGWTALHFALSTPADNQLQVVELLCAQRADANMCGSDGVTALHLAAQHSSKHVLHTLLNSGADNKRRTINGQSTVDFALYNPCAVDAYEILGWPNEGPNPDPLTLPRIHVDDGTASVAWPLLLTASWFGLVTVVAAWVIRSYS